jgi:hypothetical protein
MNIRYPQDYAKAKDVKYYQIIIELLLSPTVQTDILIALAVGMFTLLAIAKLG